MFIRDQILTRYAELQRAWLLQGSVNGCDFDNDMLFWQGA